MWVVKINRYKIYNKAVGTYLAITSGFCINDVIRQLPTNVNVVAKHMKEFKRLGLITLTKSGRRVVIRFTVNGMFVKQKLIEIQDVLPYDKNNC